MKRPIVCACRYHNKDNRYDQRREKWKPVDFDGSGTNGVDLGPYVQRDPNEVRTTKTLFSKMMFLSLTKMEMTTQRMKSFGFMMF